MRTTTTFYSISRVIAGVALVVTGLLTLTAQAALKPDSRTNLESLWAEFKADQPALDNVSYFPHAECFEQAAAKQNLPLALVVGVARGESDFQRTIISKANAHGIMQIVWPQTANHLGITEREDLFDPCINIHAGAQYLRWMMDRFEDNFYRAVAAYNYGPGGIPRSGEIKPGANAYAGYIYDHVQKVLSLGRGVVVSAAPSRSVVYNNRNTIVVNRFRARQLARNYLEYLRETFDGQAFDVFDTPLGEFEITFNYADEEERARVEKRLYDTAYISVIGPRPDVPTY